MRRTLFYIPHEIGGVPVFGWGWALLIWLVISGAILLWSARRNGWQRELRGQLPMILLVSAAVVFVIPRVEEPIVDRAWIIPPVAATAGLPIRGYGVMLLLAVVSGVTLAAVRANRAGLSAEVIMGLAFGMVVGGIVGARLFFIIQYWQLLQGETWRQTLGNLLSVDKGGLVVYGSLIGAAVAFLWFCRHHRLPALPLGDLIARKSRFGPGVGPRGLPDERLLLWRALRPCMGGRIPCGEPALPGSKGLGRPLRVSLGGNGHGPTGGHTT